MFLILPYDIYDEIFKYIDLITCMRLRGTCKTLHEYTSQFILKIRRVNGFIKRLQEPFDYHWQKNVFLLFNLHHHHRQKVWLVGALNALACTADNLFFDTLTRLYKHFPHDISGVTFEPEYLKKLYLSIGKSGSFDFIKRALEYTMNEKYPRYFYYSDVSEGLIKNGYIDVYIKLQNLDDRFKRQCPMHVCSNNPNIYSVHKKIFNSDPIWFLGVNNRFLTENDDLSRYVIDNYKDTIINGIDISSVYFIRSIKNIKLFRYFYETIFIHIKHPEILHFEEFGSIESLKYLKSLNLITISSFKDIISHWNRDTDIKLLIYIMDSIFPEGYNKNLIKPQEIIKLMEPLESHIIKKNYLKYIMKRLNFTVDDICCYIRNEKYINFNPHILFICRFSLESRPSDEHITLIKTVYENVRIFHIKVLLYFFKRFSGFRDKFIDYMRFHTDSYLVYNISRISYDETRKKICWDNSYSKRMGLQYM